MELGAQSAMRTCSPRRERNGNGRRRSSGAEASGRCAERARRRAYPVEARAVKRLVKTLGGSVRRSTSREMGEREGGSNSVVESQPSKLLVAGSIPVSRSIRLAAPRLVHGRNGWDASALSALEAGQP